MIFDEVKEDLGDPWDGHDEHQWQWRPWQLPELRCDFLDVDLTVDCLLAQAVGGKG